MAAGCWGCGVDEDRQEKGVDKDDVKTDSIRLVAHKGSPNLARDKYKTCGCKSFHELLWGLSGNP